LVIGVGIGGNLEKSGINAKKALFSDTAQTDFEKEILDKVNALNIGASGKGGTTTVLDLKIIETPCHIASLPVSVALNCHAARHASAIIDENITYNFEEYEIFEIPKSLNVKEILTTDIEKIKALKTGERILLTGTIYTARDEAHKRLLASSTKPFEIKNSIIFYAGPCPAKPNEIIGPIGPTTSSRMDDYTEKLLEKGLLGTIGKGERSAQTLDAIQKHNAVHFSAIGGIATLLAQCVKSSKLIAYEDLGPEAIYEVEIEKMPLFVDCGRIVE
jgi:fumarate hydratase class I